MKRNDILWWIGAIGQILSVLAVFVYWLVNDELTQMQVFKDVWAYFLAVGIFWWLWMNYLVKDESK